MLYSIMVLWFSILILYFFESKIQEYKYITNAKSTNYAS